MLVLLKLLDGFELIASPASILVRKLLLQLLILLSQLLGILLLALPFLDDLLVFFPALDFIISTCGVRLDEAAFVESL